MKNNREIINSLIEEIKIERHNYDILENDYNALKTKYKNLEEKYNFLEDKYNKKLDTITSIIIGIGVFMIGFFYGYIEKLKSTII